MSSITVNNTSENNGELSFTLSGVDVSVANAIRRTILSDIPIVAFKTFGEHSDATFTANTSRLNNEILSQRLSCIPIHISANDSEYNIEDLLLEVNEKNETDTMQVITTADFKIRSISTGELLSKEKCTEIFRPFISPTGDSYFIQFTRLRPRISAEIPGEMLEMTCKFSVGSAAENSMLNVVGTCAYGMTVDGEAADQALIAQQKKWESEGVSSELVERNSNNWALLERKRIIKPNSFDFIIGSVGQMSNGEIVGTSCKILVNKFKNIVQLINDGLMVSNASSEKSIEYILDNEDYTVGNVITNIMFNNYITQKNYDTAKLAFCGFKKLHPHDTHSIIRLIFDEREDDESSSNAQSSPKYATKASPDYVPASPDYVPASNLSPDYAPSSKASPDYAPASPDYAPSSKASPDYAPASPDYAPASKASPDYAPASSSTTSQTGGNLFKSLGLNYIKKCCNVAIEIFESVGEIFMK